MSITDEMVKKMLNDLSDEQKMELMLSALNNMTVVQQHDLNGVVRQISPLQLAFNHAMARGIANFVAVEMIKPEMQAKLQDLFAKVCAQVFVGKPLVDRVSQRLRDQIEGLFDRE